MNLHREIDERLLAYKPISVTLNFDWDKMSYDERVLARHNYIEEQKKKDPNYVGYDFLEHFSSLHAGGCEKSVHTTNFGRLVNTLGQVIKIYRNKVHVGFGWNEKGYKVIELHKNNKCMTLKMHRVVACTFIPIPDRLKEFSDNLVVNHKNDKRSNNFRSNLEWCTQGENSIKAVETGAIASSPFKFTITRPGDYFGKEYYFTSRSSLKDFGFSHSCVYDFINNNTRYLCGTWEIIPKEELIGKPIGMDKNTIDYIKDPKYGGNRASGWVGTIVTEGPCKGEQFVLYGKKQLEQFGFEPHRISDCTIGRLPHHKNCTWVKITLLEAVDIPIGLTEAQKEHIFGNK